MEEITPSTPEHPAVAIESSLQSAKIRLEQATNPVTHLLAQAAVTYRTWQLREYQDEL